MVLTNAEKSARYRAKDVEAYRKIKRDLARTEHHRSVRREYQRRWREANRERHNEICRLSHHKHKHKHVGKAWIRDLKKKYGITPQVYADMLAAQGGGCAICKETRMVYGRRKMHVDHCHKSGMVRGILCFPCNTKLGWYETQRERIAEYLNE